MTGRRVLEVVAFVVFLGACHGSGGEERKAPEPVEEDDGGGGNASGYCAEAQAPTALEWCRDHGY